MNFLFPHLKDELLADKIPRLCPMSSSSSEPSSRALHGHSMRRTGAQTDHSQTASLSPCSLSVLDIVGPRTLFWLLYVYLKSCKWSDKTNLMCDIVSCGNHADFDPSSRCCCVIYDTAHPDHYPGSIHSSGDRDDLVEVLPHLRVLVVPLFHCIPLLLPGNAIQDTRGN